MTPLSAAFDNIRLLRRKIRIEKEIVARSAGSERDEALVRSQDLINDLLRALDDFAEMGFEKQVSELLTERPDQAAFRKID